MRKYKGKLSKLLHGSSSKSLGRLVAKEKCLTEQSCKTIEYAVEKLDKISPEQLEAELKTVCSYLEEGFAKAPNLPSAMLKGIATIHQILLQGPDGVFKSLAVRSTLNFVTDLVEQYLHSVSERNKRLTLLGLQYGKLCQERLEISKSCSQMFDGDWSSRLLRNAPNRNFFGTFIPSRSIVYESAKYSSVTEEKSTCSSNIVILRLLITYSVSLSLLLSKLVSYLMDDSSEDLVMIGRLLLFESRGLLRAILTVWGTTIIQELIPEADESKFHNYITQYGGLGFLKLVSDDERTLWTKVRGEAQTTNGTVLSRLVSTYRKGFGASKQTVCCCQYMINGGESFLLHCLLQSLAQDLPVYYFGEKENQDSKDVKNAYMSLLRLQTATTPGSLKRVLELRDMREPILMFYDAIAKTVSGSNKTFNFYREGFQQSVQLDIARLGCFLDKEQPNFSYDGSTAASLLDLSGVICSDFNEINFCEDLPELQITLPKKRKKDERGDQENRKLIHLILHPELLPDVKLIYSAFEALAKFINIIKTCQSTLLSNRKDDISKELNNGKRKGLLPVSQGVISKSSRKHLDVALIKRKPIELKPHRDRGRHTTTHHRNNERNSGTTEPYTMPTGIRSRPKPVNIVSRPLENRIDNKEAVCDAQYEPVAFSRPVRNVIDLSDQQKNCGQRRIPSTRLQLRPSPLAPMFNVVYQQAKGALVNTNSKSLVHRQSTPNHVSLGDIQVKEIVGQGATAEVYRGCWQGTEVAVKIFKTSAPMNMSELEILFKVRHPNLVLVMGGLSDARGFLSEFCAGGTLFEALHGKNRKFQLTWKQRHKIAVDIAKGCNYLHSSNPQIVHRDLKSLNILLGAPIHSPRDVPLAKISDFGMSSSTERQDVLCGMAGTYHWMAPEIFLGHSYNEKVDVYSFGIILYELCTGFLPYSKDEERKGAWEIGRAVACEGKRPKLNKLPADCPLVLRDLMLSCWSNEPTKRPSFSSILDYLTQRTTAHSRKRE